MPPFRADHVGSLLRPPAIKEARVRHAKGEIDDAALAAIEDAEIDRAVAKQESLGLRAITDGEYRRYAWQTDFLAKLDGATMVEAVLPLPGGKQATMMIPRIVGRLGFSSHPMIDHYKFLAAHTKATPKLSIPSPNMLISILRDWRQGVSESAYADMPAFLRDVGAVYTKAVAAIGAAGCKYLQLDDCNLSYLCDPAQVAKAQARGLDPKVLLDTFVGLLNEAISARPAGMTVAVHICRGNFRSTWLAEGGYEPVADAIFNRTKVDAFFLEYDSDRAGGFEPLRFVPKDKTIVLGLVSSKTGVLEPKDTIKRRLDEAAKFVPLDQICLSPQCGFASTEDGNTLSEDQQWAKLGFVVDVAREVWGTA